MSANAPNNLAGDTQVVFTGAEPNPVLTLLQRPRIMLLLLAAWSLLGFFAQLFPGSDFSLNLGDKLDGALGGFALGWEGIPLACVYIYCFRDPVRYHAVFWLALIHMASMAVSQIYHLASHDLAFTGIIIPLAGSLGLAALVFLHLFSPKPHPATTATQQQTE
jgi:hypothetical protein